MNDPLGFISNASPLQAPNAGKAARPESGGEGPDFRAVLENQLEEVNRHQSEARRLTEALAAGEGDLESVILATQKADTAFQLLLQVRNKVMTAIEEVKQVRV